VQVTTASLKSICDIQTGLSVSRAGPSLNHHSELATAQSSLAEHFGQCPSKLLQLHPDANAAENSCSVSLSVFDAIFNTGTVDVMTSVPMLMRNSIRNLQLLVRPPLVSIRQISSIVPALVQRGGRECTPIHLLMPSLSLFILFPWSRADPLSQAT
jgi:hypothetical protein